MQSDDDLSKQALIGLLDDSRRELEALRRRQAACAELAVVGFLTLDADGIVCELNRPVASLLGCPPEALLRQPLSRCLSAESRDILQGHLHRLAAGGERVSSELEPIPTDAEPPRRVRLDSRPWHEPGGEPGYLSSLVGISERRPSELVPGERDERPEPVATDTCDAIRVWDVPHRRIYFSPRWKEFRGYAAHEVSDREEEWRDNIHPEDLPRVMAAVREHFTGKTAVFAEEYRIRCKDGAWKWILDRGIAHKDADGRVVRMACSESDITQRKQAEHELAGVRRAAEQRAAELEALLQAVPAAVWIAHDRECRHISGNRTANAWLRLPDGAEASLTAAGDARPGHFKVYRQDRELRSDELPVQLAAKGMEVRDFEQEIVFEDGSVMPVFGNATPLWDEQGRPRGAVSAFVDISERKLAEQTLIETDRRKDEFLAILAHELRNPLAPIRNAVEILNLHLGDDVNLHTAHRIIERQLQHMVRLIDDLLDVGRISRGRLELCRESVELEAVLHHAIETVQPQIQGLAHRLALQLLPQPVYLEADPVRLAQVFVNLLNNACSYTPPGGRIDLIAQLEGSEVVVRVLDSGIGIAAEFLPRLFEMFSQVGPVLERSRGGLGLGLSLAKQLVELHGGRIEAASPGPGQGSEFSIHLPLDSQTDARHRHDAGTRGPGSPGPGAALRVLLVDDNRDALQSLAMLLGASGHQVETADDGFAGVAAAERFHPDLILLDIGMPGMDGYTTCRRIREQPWGGEIRIIALTGWGKDEDRRRAKAAGFDGHLVKPVDFASLQQLLVETRPSGSAQPKQHP